MLACVLTVTPPAGRLHVSVLGPPTLLVGGQQNPLPAGRPGRLLAVLVLARGRVVGADRLVDLIWGEEAPADSRAALHTTVKRARHALRSASDLVARQPAGYLLRRDGVSVDADLFLAAAAEAGAAGEVAAFDRALAWWRGPAWAGLDQDIAHGEAVRLEEERRNVREGRADALLRTGRLGEAIADLRVLVSEEPLRERSVGLLMRAQHAAGNVAEALSTYDTHRDQLADQLGLDPSAELAALHQQVLRRAVQKPPTPTPVARPRAPSLPIVELYGREGQLAAIRSMVGRHRCVTVIGPGGVGKTSIAAEIARGYSGGDQVWWVDLTSVGHPSGVRAAVADAVEALAFPGATLEAALRGRLELATGLLVLDNCEHLLAETGDLVADILGWNSAVTVLATSRERLGVNGEHVFPLPPLQLPAADSPEPDPSGPALTLFMERATAAAPDLRLDPDTVADMVALVRALDGLPLAIELAAGRVGSVTLGDLRASLSGRLDLLRTGSRRTHARHRTLAATIEWSFDLLTSDEQQTFVGLSVFAGSFDLQAVSAVLGPDAAALVADLVDRSLVVRPGPTGPGRYRLLETLRAFARARLDGADGERLSRAHAAWAADLAARADAGLVGSDEAWWSAEIERSLPDLNTAFRWAVAAGAATTAGSLVASLRRWAYHRVRPDVLGWSEDVLALDADHVVPDVYAAAANHCWMVGRFDESRRYAEAGIAAAGGATAPAAARSQDALGDAAMAVGDLDLALSAFTRSSLLSTERGHPVDAAIGASGMLLTLTYAGRPTGIELARLRELTAPLDNPTSLAICWYCEGEVTAETSPVWALRQLVRAAELAGTVGNHLFRGVSMIAETALRARVGALDAETVERTCQTIEMWLGSGSENLLVTCLRNVVPLLGRFQAHTAVVELVAALAAAAGSRPAYGAEAERIDACLARARAALGADAEIAWARGP